MNTFPYIFGAYFLVGLVVFVVRRKTAKAPDLRTEFAEEALAS